MKLLPQSLQSIFFLKVPRPSTRDFSAILPLVRARVSPYLFVWKNELVTSFPRESDKFVSSELILLAPEWFVVKIALFWWAHRRVPHRTCTRVPCLCRRNRSGRSLYKSLSSRSCRSRWVHKEFIDRQRSLRCRWGWRKRWQRWNAHVQARGWRRMRVWQPLSQSCALHSQSLALHKLQTHTLPLWMCKRTVHVQTTLIKKSTDVLLVSMYLETELWEADG